MSPFIFSTDTTPPADIEATISAHPMAALWRAHLAPLPASAHLADTANTLGLQDSIPVFPVAVPDEINRHHQIEALAEFIATCLLHRETALLVVPDDEWLPDISNALDIELRPYCLVLPEADFAAATTLRATLSLLKSRLSRPTPSEYTACQEAQRTRLDEHATLWQSALDWSAAGFFSGAWPEGTENLFPILILPIAQAANLQPRTPSDSQSDTQPSITTVRRDILLTFHIGSTAQGNTPPIKWQLSASKGLCLRNIAPSPRHEITPIDLHHRLRLERDVLVQELGDMELEFATAQAELAEFTRRYHDIIAHRLTELDQLHAQIARILADRTPHHPEMQQRAQQAHAQAEQSKQEHQRYNELDRDRPKEKPFVPSKNIKRLFRQLAQKIHPDRARNEADRAWRTELMSEANRAYRNDDEMVLRDILEQWQAGRPQTASSPTSASTSSLAESRAAAASASHAAFGNDPDSETTLQHEIQRIQRRIAHISTQLNRLLASKLYELYTAATLARRRDRDLLKEMAEQLDTRIAAARIQLQRLTSQDES